VGITEILLRMLKWLGLVHAVVSAEVSAMFYVALSGAVFTGVLETLFYLAMEPWVRARWPQSLITWSRLLSGKWRDAQVNGHILIGAALGMGLWSVAELRQVLSISGSGLNTGTGLFVAEGTRQWISLVFSDAEEALRLGLIIFFSIFGMRMLLRRDWLAAIGTAVVFTFLEGNLAKTADLPGEVAVYLVVYTALMFVLLRVGLLTTISAVFFANIVGSISVGLDWGTWYAPYGIAGLAMTLGLVLWAFGNSLGSGGLLGEAGAGRG
jgi:serine/threonine-protein kinase